MRSLNNFIKLLTGSFDNRKQFEAENPIDPDFPFAEHVNTICNNRITGLPADFEGYFMVEECYYTVREKTSVHCHLFLFSEGSEGIELVSYELPDNYICSEFTEVPYEKLHPIENQSTAVYSWKEGCWKGGSGSMFSPVLKFNLGEKMTVEYMETGVYEKPIFYRRNE